MNIGDEAKISEKKLDHGMIVITYPYDKFKINDLYAEFTSIKNFFIDRDVIMIPKELSIYNSTEELIDIRNRIDKELNYRRSK